MKNPAASPAAGFLRVIGPSPRGRCGRRDALHARAGGTIEPRRGTGTGPGRPYRPPLHAPAAGSGCRGAFYMRPGRTAGIGRLSVIATRSRRHVGMPPYARSGRRTALHTETGGPMWASAPTDSRKRGLTAAHDAAAAAGHDLDQVVLGLAALDPLHDRSRIGQAADDADLELGALVGEGEFLDGVGAPEGKAQRADALELLTGTDAVAAENALIGVADDGRGAVVDLPGRVFSNRIWVTPSR